MLISRGLKVASLLPKWIRRQFQAWKSVPLKPRNEASHPQPQGLTLSNECVCLEEADPFSRNAREAGGEPPEGLHILMEAVEIFFSSQELHTVEDTMLQSVIYSPVPVQDGDENISYDDMPELVSMTGSGSSFGA